MQGYYAKEPRCICPAYHGKLRNAMPSELEHNGVQSLVGISPDESIFPPLSHLCGAHPKQTKMRSRRPPGAGPCVSNASHTGRVLSRENAENSAVVAGNGQRPTPPTPTSLLILLSCRQVLRS